MKKQSPYLFIAKYSEEYIVFPKSIVMQQLLLCSLAQAFCNMWWQHNNWTLSLRTVDYTICNFVFCIWELCASVCLWVCVWVCAYLWSLVFAAPIHWVSSYVQYSKVTLLQFDQKCFLYQYQECLSLKMNRAFTNATAIFQSYGIRSSQYFQQMCDNIPKSSIVSLKYFQWWLLLCIVDSS